VSGISLFLRIDAYHFGTQAGKQGVSANAKQTKSFFGDVQDTLRTGEDDEGQYRRRWLAR